MWSVSLESMEANGPIITKSGRAFWFDRFLIDNARFLFIPCHWVIQAPA